MIIIKKHISIYSLKKKWMEIESSGINVYQSYFVQKAIAKNLPIYALPGGYRPVYFEIIEDDKTVMILPLCKYWKQNKFGIIGDFNGVQSFDFLYSSSVSHEKMKMYLSEFLKYIKGYSLVIKNLPSVSLVYKVFKEMGCILEEDSNQNVNIFIGNTYEEYYSKLSKSTRQNIRTAYNRMNKDGLDYKFDFIINKPLGKEKLSQIIDIYCERHSSRYNVKTSKLKKFYLKHFDFSTKCQQKYKNIYCLLYINDKIAAFMSGLINEKDESVIIPRLSIVEDFYRYSPGIVLINETAKKFEKFPSLNNLDLSKGNETYKTVMGGIVYETKNFIVKG